MEQKSFETWAIIELFGHQQIAGLVTETTIDGSFYNAYNQILNRIISIVS